MVIKFNLATNKIEKINKPSFLLFFCLHLLSLCIHVIMMKYFGDSMTLCHLSNIQLEMNFTLNKQRPWSESLKAIIPCERC